MSLLIFRTQTESGAYSRDSSRVPRRRPSIYTAIRHRVSPVFIRSRNCVPKSFTAESPPARVSSPQGSSSNECCLCRFHHGPTNLRLSFPHPLLWYDVDMCEGIKHGIPPKGPRKRFPLSFSLVWIEEVPKTAALVKIVGESSSGKIPRRNVENKFSFSGKTSINS